MKYIIEIEDEPFGRNDDPLIPHGMDELYRAKGYRSLVFDKVGLSKLTPYVEPDVDSYEDGVNDAWNAAAYMAKKHGLPFGFFEECDRFLVIEEMKKRGDLKLGDEVEWEDGKGVLFDQVDIDGEWWLLIDKNRHIKRMHESHFHKTGKTYTAVIDIVKELGEK